MEPVSERERIDSLDVLRGVAVLGILPVNIQAFAMIDAAYANPRAFGDLTGANYIVWIMTHFCFEGKFITIFSLLFGAGIALMNDRRSGSGSIPMRIHFRRMAVLLAIGLLHAYGVWHGDILVAYALCGSIVYFFRMLQPGIQLGMSVAFYLVPVAMLLLLQATMPWWPAEDLAEFASEWNPDQAAIIEELTAMRGSWWSQMPLRAHQAMLLQTGGFLVFTSWTGCGLMSMGMALFRRGMFNAAWPTSHYVGMIVAGLAVGLPLILLGVKLNESVSSNFAYSNLVGGIFNYLAAPCVAAAWIGIVMLTCRNSRLVHVKRWPAAVGRMALTNYLCQSLICSLIFFGHGLGLFGKVERVGQAMIVVLLWTVEIAISTLWLWRFRFGPFEWAWRCATYGTRQPFRRITISAG